MPPTISSRTPEGAPNHCPVCDALICIEPSQPPGDAPCPSCGVLLWFIPTSGGMRFHPTDAATPVRERIAEILSRELGVNRENVVHSLSSFADLGVDSLNIVELVMELEMEFDVTIPDDEAEKIRTPGDAVDWLLRHLT
jgi:acyl carrier protein